MCTLKGNRSGKKNIFFIPSIDRVCGSDAQGEKSDLLHSSVRRYKPLRSSTKLWVWPFDDAIVGIAITSS